MVLPVLPGFVLLWKGATQRLLILLLLQVL